MSNLNHDQFGEQPNPKRVAYLLPVSAKGETLFVKPDVNGHAGVDVHDYDEYAHVVAGKSAHRYDFDNDKFSRAKVHHWVHIDDGGTARFEIPAGGGLGDAQRIEPKR